MRARAPRRRTALTADGRASTEAVAARTPRTGAPCHVEGKHPPRTREKRSTPAKAAPARGPAALIASPALNGKVMLGFQPSEGFQPSPDEPPPEPSSTGTQRKQWSNAEDTLVRQLVQAHGTRSWTLVAQHLPGRTGKQCRERWHNHLDHDIRKDAWCARDRARHRGDEGRVAARAAERSCARACAGRCRRTGCCLSSTRNLATSGPTSPSAHTRPYPLPPPSRHGAVARAHAGSTRASRMQVPARPDRQRGEESLELCASPRLEHRPRPRRRPSP